MRANTYKMYLLTFLIPIILSTNLMASLQKAKKLIEDLPDYGYGLLKNVRNNTDYPVTISSGEKDKILNDELPEGTTIRIKPADSKSGYYALKKQKDGSFTLHYDPKNKGDATSQFRVSRYILYSSKTRTLEDYLVLASMDSENWALGLTEKGDDKGDVELTRSKDFKDKKLDAENMENHWYLDGTSLESCFLRNRKTKGALAPYAGTRQYKITHKVELRTVVGIDAVTKLPVIYKAPTVEQAGDTTFWNPIGSPDKGPGQATSIACQNEDNIWVTNTKKEVWQWDGTAWKQIQTPVKFAQVSVTANGKTIWAVDEDNKVYARTESGWQKFSENKKYVSVYSAKGAWAVGAATKAEKDVSAEIVPEGVKKPDPEKQKPTEGKFYHYVGGTTWDEPATDSKIVAVSGISAEIAWAVNTNGKLLKLSKGKWQIADTPQNISAAEVAIRGNDDVWMVDSNNNAWWWNGKTWKQRIGKVTQIALARGTDTVVDRIEPREINVVRTTTPDGKPIKDPSAAVQIEVVSLGLGGNLPSKQTITINLPAPKSPRVSGFASTTLENFAPGTLMSLNPLFGKGVAWPEQSLQTPGRCTVAFLARADDRGDIQVVFGTEMSEKYIWKIRIGFISKDMTWSGIFRKNPATGKDDTLYAINQKSSQFAACSPGNFTPYWVSFDNGFIMVGLGAPGENVFMAYRTDDPLASSIDRVGFSCNKQGVDFTDIQFLTPVIVDEPQRVYKETGDSVQAGGGITWSKYPFRVPDRGTVAFTLQGSNGAQVAFGQKASETNDHYIVAFSEANEQGTVSNAIAIKKWMTQTKTYATRAVLPIASCPELQLDPSNPVNGWISYQDGLFAIGIGDIGQKPVMVFQDINELTNIHQIGFGNGSFSNIKIASAARLRIEPLTEAYKQGQGWYKYQGSIKIILPFEYIISQEGPSVTAKDMLSGLTFFTGGTPSAGADYFLMLNIKEDGYPDLTTQGQFESAKSVSLKQAALDAQTQSQLDLQKASLSEQEGSIAEKLAQAQGAVLKTQGESQRKTAEAMTSAAGSIAFAGGMDPVSTGIALGTTTALSMAAIGVSADASRFEIAASQQDLKGAQAAAYQQRQSLKAQAAAANKSAFASYLNGATQFAFKDPNAYVYVDNPVRPALGARDVPPEVLENAQRVQVLIEKAGAIKPTTQAKFEIILGHLQDIVLLCSHAYVINDFVKQKFVLLTSGLYDAYQALFTQKPDIRVTNDFMNLLLTAMNNGYLLDATKDAERLETFYTWTNKLAQTVITKKKSIDLRPTYGEYIWYPIQPSDSTNFTVTITVEGRHDAFVCLAKEPGRVRNTLADIYEIALAGWDNTKHAFRIQSLGRSVREFTAEKYPGTMMNPLSPQTYTIKFNNGTLSVTCAGKTMTWLDPYPIEGLGWVGISNWDSPVTFSKVVIQPSVQDQTIKPSDVLKPKPAQSPTKKTIKKTTSTKTTTTKPVTTTKAPKPTTQVTKTQAVETTEESGK